MEHLSHIVLCIVIGLAAWLSLNRLRALDCANRENARRISRLTEALARLRMPESAGAAPAPQSTHDRPAPPVASVSSPKPKRVWATPFGVMKNLTPEDEAALEEGLRYNRANGWS